MKKPYSFGCWNLEFLPVPPKRFDGGVRCLEFGVWSFRRAVYSLALVLTLAGCIPPKKTSSTSPLAHTYSNPVYPGSMPDPSVIRYKGTYYAFGTTGAERTRDGRIFTALRSKDLLNWEWLGGALLPPSAEAHTQYWAPEVTENAGMFYLYYAMGGLEPEKFELRVATSVRPEGPYVDAAKLVDCESNRF